MDAKDMDHQSENGDTENAEEGTLLLQLRKEKETMETEFGQKRAKFKELFMQKEEELQAERQQREALAEKLHALQRDLDEARSLLLVAQCEQENELEGERRRHREEMASLQHILKENTEEALRSSGRYEKELARYKKHSERLEQELHELRAQQAQDSDNSVENLEESMRKAQEDAEMLRSLVVPLEEEIKALKDKLRSTDEQLHVYEAAFTGLVHGLGSGTLGDAVRGGTPAEILSHLDDKLTSLCKGLQAEKASRSDLEMYVAVLNTQKMVMQEDTDQLRKQFQEVCNLLEREKREHSCLKRTWQMANDRFLEAQQAHVRDLARLQAVLTADQQRHLAHLRKADVPPTSPRKKEGDTTGTNSELVPCPLQEPELQEALHSVSPLPTSSPKAGLRFMALEPRLFSKASTLPGRKSNDRMRSSPAELNACKPPATLLAAKQSHRRSLSSSDLPSEMDNSLSVPAMKGLEDTRSLGDYGGAVITGGGIGLTGDQLSALSERHTSDPSKAYATPEMEARKSLMEVARTDYDDGLGVGKRVVSDKEWRLLEEELKRLRERLCQPCEMCSNYELQLQQVQRDLDRHTKELGTARQDLSRERDHRQQLEQRFADSATDVQHQVSELQARLGASEAALAETQQAHAECSQQTHEELSRLHAQLVSLRDQAERLSQENQQLLGRYVAKARQLQDQPINLPDSLEELRFQCLQLQEDLIKVQLDKETLEENLRGQILFLRDQASSEMNCKQQIERTLTHEADQLRRQLDLLTGIREQLEKERQLREQKEKCLQACEAQLALLKSQLDERVVSLQRGHDQLTTTKEKLEEEVTRLRGRVQTLQMELDNSEAVQRDFVKLSQSLQVELEKIRQSDSEVRWQHEDDVNECNGCKKALHSRKEKPHCNHCGKIFCTECLGRVVRSGPKLRPFAVCNVCHTLLDRDTAPYFSSEPPQTPS
ncbi:rab GTPase-binding effector protein 1 isoform X3 [Dermacentor silvarum]|uniref:rab GTPase-binding effector protein 1 isoform X3 n=1 Tax=Dermacentor silvarum TaxID=543639 RepID=UPI002101B2FD|nr:rab GTPase-binding effector protein 1 isoform X3 [Dermacentor silvarum]